VVATLHDVRRLAVELRPAALDDFGLASAVERLVDTFREQSGLQVDLESGSLGPDRLPSEVETVLYRIVQEALTNVAKHSDAHRVSIVLTRREGRAAAIVEDDGLGFDPQAQSKTGLGLVGMRERVTLVGGRIQIESAAEAGTTLVAEVPLG
jgi:signal transduction histidine kinase